MRLRGPDVPLEVGAGLRIPARVLIDARIAKVPRPDFDIGRLNGPYMNVRMLNGWQAGKEHDRVARAVRGDCHSQSSGRQSKQPAERVLYGLTVHDSSPPCRPTRLPFPRLTTPNRSRASTACSRA